MEKEPQAMETFRQISGYAQIALLPLNVTMAILCAGQKEWVKAAGFGVTAAVVAFALLAA
ncbi:hypothetical protein C7I85_30050 [Mesorhizobium soli]|uniref:Uncharacterized protein n=1 Tax=Pseudaminobacter soli (ex Li et al. 2025) TaxID=1295366 RepID=A0A2P7RK40_9HYPH|nr:hypothetical protein C7I85_30050 [Mesorhizobium soli]